MLRYNIHVRTTRKQRTVAQAMLGMLIAYPAHWIRFNILPQILNFIHTLEHSTRGTEIYTSKKNVLSIPKTGSLKRTAQFSRF